MSSKPSTLRGLVKQMLGMAGDRHGGRIEKDAEGFAVTLSGDRIAFAEEGGTTGLALEKLAFAIETSIAVTRSRAMMEAAGEDPVRPPLWLVSGSRALAEWIAWSRTETALKKVLTLSDRPGWAPVTGYLDRRARHELGQGGARIRVNGGQAVAERIELFGKLRCNAIFGQEVAQIRVEGVRLPDTLVMSAKRDREANYARRVAEIVGHPFLAATEFILGAVHNDGENVVIDLEDDWVSLAPVPVAALKALPRDVDPESPWRITARESAALYKLVDEGRRHVGTV